MSPGEEPPAKQAVAELGREPWCAYAHSTARAREPPLELGVHGTCTREGSLTGIAQPLRGVSETASGGSTLQSAAWDSECHQAAAPVSAAHMCTYLRACISVRHRHSFGKDSEGSLDCSGLTGIPAVVPGINTFN